MSSRRILLFLGVNLVVSVATTLIVLTLWESRQVTASRTPTVPPMTVIAASTLVVPTVMTETQTVQFQSTAVALAPKTYSVQAGDTLLGISQKFDVDLDELMKANKLNQQSILSIGQKLTIPVGGLPTASPAPPTATGTISPLIIPTPIATATPGQGQASLFIENVVGRGELNGEAVVLANDGEQVRLDGWTLSDSQGNSYKFPSLVLFKGGAITIHTGSGTDTPTDLYWGQTTPRWTTSGVTILLKDASGAVRAQQTLP